MNFEKKFVWFATTPSSTFSLLPFFLVLTIPYRKGHIDIYTFHLTSTLFTNISLQPLFFRRYNEGVQEREFTAKNAADIRRKFLRDLEKEVASRDRKLEKARLKALEEEAKLQRQREAAEERKRETKAQQKKNVDNSRKVED